MPLRSIEEAASGKLEFVSCGSTQFKVNDHTWDEFKHGQARGKVVVTKKH